jgi:hypothetical protein
MLKYVLSAALTALAIVTLPMLARADIVADGITYSIGATGLNTSTANFSLSITGINAATDTEGGRFGVNAFAFNNVNLLPGLTGTSPGFTFMAGGLSSGGCDGSGGFFCFADIAPHPSTLLPAGSSILIPFSLTVSSGTFAAWANSDPHFKIDWLGTKNNYDLVSLGGTGVSVNPLCTAEPCVTAVPAPIVGVGLPGLVAALLSLIGLRTYRRRRVIGFA